MAGHDQGRHTTFNHVSLGSSWLCSLLRLSLFLMTLTIMRNAGQVFCGMPFTWDLPDVFSWLDWGYWIWEEDHWSQGPFSSHCIKGTYCQCGLTTTEADLDHLAEMGFVGFLFFQITLFLIFFILHSLEGCRHVQPIVKSGEFCFTSLRAECLHKLLKILLQMRSVYSSPLIRFLNHLFM